jgi:hypothetical protein
MLAMARRFEKMIPIPTRPGRVIRWVWHYCVVPDGPNRGQPAVLSLHKGLLPSLSSVNL